MISLNKILSGIEYFFWVMAALALTYAAYFFLGEMKNFNGYSSPPVTKKVLMKPANVEVAISNDAKPFDYYEKQINNRDIFSGTAAVPVKGVAAQPQLVAGELPPNLKIVGIMLGDKPQVVIEDSNSQQTYFIEKGAPQAGIDIDHVKDEAVFLNYNGQIINVNLKGSQINLQPKNS